VIAVLAVHAVVALACAALGRRLGRHVLLVGALAPASSLVWLATGPSPTEKISWLPAVGLDLELRLDGFGTLMVALVGGIGVLVFLYAWHYFGERPRLVLFTSYLVGFAGAMFGVVVADNLLVLYLFWELTSIASYLLIGFEDEEGVARSAALQALLVTTLGGLAMLAGLVMLAQSAGTYSLSGLLGGPPTGPTVAPALVLVLLGAFTKSAQFPFHFWLPGAMTAPTPVSAYLHSATMVKAGIYLVARLAPAFAGLHEWWRPLVCGVGVVTMIWSGWRATFQTDLKLILAQGTVSQLGFIMALVGLGLPEATFAGVAMILAHAVFKAALFMVAGIVDHEAGTRDIRRLGDLGRSMPVAAAVAVVAAASMVGLPPLLGFVTKETALASLLSEAGWPATIAVAAGSILTTAYALRFLAGGFTRYATDDREIVVDEAHSPAAGFVAGPVLLAIVTIVAGVFPRLVDGLVAGAAGALGSEGHHLALWHGFNVPLLLSAAAIAGGWLLWRYPPRAVQEAAARLPRAKMVYASAIVALNRIADRVTSIVQNGSLPIYLGVIVATAVIGPGVILTRAFRLPESLIIAENSIQAVTALLVCVAAIGTANVKRRLGAVLFLSAVGYGVAVLFVIQGAPDLALTQMLIETLTLGLFVLVLHHLPTHFENIGWRLRQASRLILSILTGVTAGAFALWAAASRQAAPLSGEYLTRSQPEGGGANVVNVILTDFRAYDTLGEITVLTVVALGAAALILTGRGRSEVPHNDEELVGQKGGDDR
jgi:multicomponent Na+:H+ antiporter subunit A